jgi:hypothetical protein
MNGSQLQSFVTWHVECGSATSTRSAGMLRSSHQLATRLITTEFDVQSTTEVEGDHAGLVGQSVQVATSGGRLFDAVFGCRIYLPHLRVRLASRSIEHLGIGRYIPLDPFSEILFGTTNEPAGLRCRVAGIDVPDGFLFKPYLSDESDCWKIHARLIAKRGTGYFRVWAVGREILRWRIGDDAQFTRSEVDAGTFRYRLVRTGAYRETPVVPGWRASTRIALHSNRVPVP